MTTPRNRKHLRSIVTESVRRFGWWATLHECTEALRATWREEMRKDDRPQTQGEDDTHHKRQVDS